MTIHTGFILNTITICLSLSTCLISLIISIVIIYHCCYNRIRQEDKVTIIHGISIYILLLIYTAILLSFNIQTFVGDLYEIDFNSFRCIFMGYFSPVIIGTLYCGFGNQVIIL